ncbi:MAG: radical SAM protein, partial [Deltaproteobacteria bacterium]|nr:radical SAM protein [Deltaproteobacteria bacterium]
VERIRDELIWAGKNDIEDLFLYSSNIDPRKVNFQELKRNINEIYGASRYRLRFDLDMKAHDAGVLPFFSGLNLYQLSFGIQSIHNRVLRKVHRTPLDLRHLKETIIETSKRYKVHIETMIGLPGDSYEGFRETMDWLLSINEERPDTIGEINVAWTMAVPGTPMHSDPRKYGIRRFHSASLPYIVETDTFSYDEMEKALNYLSEIKEFQRVGWFDMDPRHAFPDTGAVSKLLDYKEFGSQAREYEEEGKIAPVHPEQEELLRGVKSLLAAADFSSNPLNGWSFEKCETSVEGIHLVFSRPGKVQSKILISRRKDSAPAYARSRNYNFSYLAASGVPPDMVFINSLRDMILKMDV